MPTFTPAAFDYYAVSSFEEAIKILQENEDAKVIAGGQSLLPMMKLRLLTPNVLVDIGKVPGLNYIREEEDFIAIGALATHDEVANSDLLRQKCPLLSEAASRIADQQIRNRGTIGGSISHADPAADYLSTLVALEARVVIKGPQGERTVDAKDFFIDVFTTALEPAELVKEVKVPILSPRTGHAYMKFIKREGEFSTVNVAVLLTLDEEDMVKDVRVGLGAVAPKPLRAVKVEEALAGKKISEELIREASQYADEGTDPPSDVHASSEYRRHLVKVMTRRALLRALERARGVFK
jgi:carbon-monoxide dehydrogenase medium subunit